MSDRKRRRLSPDFSAAYTDIQSVLLRIKPKLGGKHSEYSSLRSDLLHLAVLAESLSKHRPRAKKDDEWTRRADDLDHQGVTLWNVSVMQKDVPDDDYRSVCAAMRLAAFRLIEAGIEHKPGIQSGYRARLRHVQIYSAHVRLFPPALIHVLQLASKAGASLADVEDVTLAAGVLGSAAKYADLLKAAEDPQDEHAQARARAMVLYYSSRMEAAFREGNDGVADFMLEKVSESDQYLSLLTPSDRRTLAGKLLGIGKNMLRSSTPADAAGNGARDTVKWIQKAFAIIEPLEDTADAGDELLRRSILRTLARAYFLSSGQDPENLARAEASLQELIDSVESSMDHTSPEFQQLRWMRVAILKRRKAPRANLLEAFRSIISHMQYSEGTITDILLELRSLGHDQGLVTAIHVHCLERAFEAQNSSGLVYLDRLLVSLIYHCSKDDDHARALQELSAALDLLDAKEYELPKIPTTACLTLLWQFGDRHYHAKRWGTAADWFLIGTHRVFGSMSHISNAKCIRKAALCYIQCGEHAQASAIIRRCPPTEAATHYVALLIAAHQGLEDEAVAAVREMVHASNFNKRMLLLATRLANESGMKNLLLSVLDALLEASVQVGVEAEPEAITLVRCIIRLVLRMMSEPAADLAAFIPMLLRHFSTALSVVAALETKEANAVGTKDVSWLWRTAYNTAVQGCSEWENQEDSISDLFDIARQLLQIYTRCPAVDTDAELQMFLINASFAGAAGRVFASRRQASNHATADADRWGLVAQEVASCNKSISQLISGTNSLDDEDMQNARSFLSILSVFGVEIACRLKTWNRVLEIIEDISRAQKVDLNTFEAITDILWVEKGCPIDVLFAALEGILHASLDRAALSVEKFSRWLRAICTILLSRSAPADRTKAVQYVEQAVGVLQDHAAERDPQGYPMDERHWLLATAYNTGIECLHSSMLDEAKRWFEAATTVCRFVPDGESRAEKISKTYSQLLERYSR
ncbi:meiosis protein SPO22/ZIP4 like-domain-containing protein [Lenzites betulinus]|nr:meiosis protein SPO22/ZIP4 like-domain-containing protein [Lenzites betulinus]